MSRRLIIHCYLANILQDKVNQMKVNIRTEITKPPFFLLAH